MPLEPRAAVAEWNGDTLTAWVGTQRPFGVREELAQAFRIPTTQVRVVVPPFGSGYGGKHTGEVAIEAARLAKAAGKPVKVVWSRAEEFQWAYFRPAGVIEIASGMSADGLLTAWDFVNHHSGRAAIEGVYRIANNRTQFVTLTPPLRSGSYRALAATANNFAREVHIDELASLAKMDPLAFRLKNIENPRARAVLEAAAERFGWGEAAQRRRAAPASPSASTRAATSATAVELEPRARTGAEAAPRRRRLRMRRDRQSRRAAASDRRRRHSGDRRRAVRGGRLRRRPRVERHVATVSRAAVRGRAADRVVMIDRKDLPSAGAGETPIIGLAPAIANAMFTATGERRRSLPLAPARAGRSQGRRVF